jgi:hypothetical protein
VLEIRGTSLSISAPTLALASKVGAWIAITEVAAGATLGSAAFIPVGLAVMAGIAAAGANKTFQDIISDPEFWDSLGNLELGECLQSNFGFSIGDLLKALLLAPFTGTLNLHPSTNDHYLHARNWTPPRAPLALAGQRGDEYDVFVEPPRAGGSLLLTLAVSLSHSPHGFFNALVSLLAAS